MFLQRIARFAKPILLSAPKTNVLCTRSFKNFGHGREYTTKIHAAWVTLLMFVFSVNILDYKSMYRLIWPDEIRKETPQLNNPGD